MGFTLRDLVALLLIIGLGTALTLSIVPHFGSLTYLAAIFVVPLVLIIYYLGFYFKKRALLLFAEWPAIERLMPLKWRRRAVYKAMLVILAIWLATLALIRPQWGYRLENIERRGVDIALVVDVSRSMLAGDIDPNRLTRAKREISDLLERLDGDRVALVPFAGIPFVECPLTLDYGAIRMFLDQLAPDLIPVPGTALAAAIDSATNLLKDSPRESKAIILITDGEDHEGKPLEAAKRAAEEGVRIYAIGIGKNESAPIPEEKGGFKTDRRGEMITTALDETILQKIALETGGAYVRSVSGEMDLEAIYDQNIKVNLEAKEQSSTMRKLWQEGYQFFLAPAVLLLGLAFLL